MIFTYCSSNDDNSYYNLDVNAVIHVIDQEGLDLLNPENSNAYNQENIKIFYLLDGNVEEVYDSNMDNPRNFKIVSPEESGDSFYVMSLTLNTNILENAVTYIEWNDIDTDTLMTNYRVGENFKICSRILYNNDVVWDENENTGSRFFEIIK